MIENRLGSLMVVTGPSGAGKGTVITLLMAEMKGLYYSISATTRAPRSNEQDGVHYYFLSRPQFQQMIEEERFLEYAEYVGNFYGTPKDPVDTQLRQGNDVILEIEVEGALKVKRKRPDACLIFITPPTFAELQRRLESRGSEHEQVIKKRLEKAKSEYAHIDQYDYLVINDDPVSAASELQAIITASRCRMGSRECQLKELFLKNKEESSCSIHP